MGAADRIRIGAVLLAGGASRRFGSENKLLASVEGQPMVTRVAREVLAADVDDIVVVTGAEHEGYVTALSGLLVRIVPNSKWDRLPWASALCQLASTGLSSFLGTFPISLPTFFGG